jgi:hypothetical protein
MNASTRLLIWSVGATLLCASSKADLIYLVSLDTSPLLGHPAAPFSLNFQLNDGSGSGNGNNTAILGQFSFGAGGGASGTPSLLGGAAGDFDSSVVITDSSFLNYFAQEFIPGSALTFRLELTSNVEPGPQPDQFSLALLDNSGFEVPTLGPFNALLVIDITAPMPLPQVFASDGSVAPFGGGDPINLTAPEVTAVPEPGTGVLLATALAILLGVRRTVRASRRARSGEAGQLPLSHLSPSQ